MRAADLRASSVARASGPTSPSPHAAGRPRRGDIQGLRAVAILAVVAFHGRLGASGGFTGVDVFFAISGFVITSTLVRELEATDRIALPAFYGRRVKRLLPALAVVILFVAVAGSLATPVAATHVAGMTGFFASFFAANAYLYWLPSGYFSLTTQLDPLLHTWTLAVEEQFYLVFPALLFGAWWFGMRRGGRGRLSAGIVIAAVCVESLWLADRSSLIPGFGFAYYASPARAWEFAAGSLIALTAPVWHRLPRSAALVLAALGLSGIAFVAFGGSATSGLLVIGIIPVASACALLAAGSAPNLVSSVLGLRPLAWIGDLSYSWYLWHWPLIVFAVALAPGHGSAAQIAAIASIVPAWLSYRFVENPIRFSPRIHGRRLVQLAAACIAIPALVSITAAQLPLTRVPAYEAAQHADLLRGCDTDALYSAPSRAPCTWPVRNPRGDVVLIGDSNAGHFTEPFVKAANEAGFSATVAAPSGCPFTQLDISKATYDYAPCVRFNHDALRELERLRPSLLVISSRTDLYLRDGAFGFGRTDRTLSTDTGVKQRLWAADLAAEITAVNGAGVPVVLLHPVPYLPTSGGGCAVVRVLADRCGGGISRREVDQQLAGATAVEREAVRGTQAWIVNFEEQLCPNGRCSGSHQYLYRNRITSAWPAR